MIEIATKKLATLVQQAEDAKALAFAKERASVLESKVVQLGNAQAGGAAIATAMDQHERAVDLQMARYRAWQEQEQLLTRVNAWIAERPPGTVLEPVPSPLVAVNGAPHVAIGEIRTKIAKLATEHHAIRTTDAPLDDAKRQARELVETLGKQGRPRITTMFGQVRVHGWGDEISNSVPAPHIAAVQFMAWLDPDRMIARLDAVLEALPGDFPGIGKLPLSERAPRLAQIEAQISDLEIQEEVFIEQAAKDNVVIERRPDQGVPSILGVRIAKSNSSRVRAA